MLSLQKTFFTLCLIALVSWYLPGSRGQAIGTPICVQKCVDIAAVNAGCFDPEETSCFCNSQTFLTSAHACIARCSVAEQADATNEYHQLCGTGTSSLASGGSSTLTIKATSTAGDTTTTATTTNPLSIPIPPTTSVQTQGAETQATVGSAGTGGLPGSKNGAEFSPRVPRVWGLTLVTLGGIAGGIFLL